MQVILLSLATFLSTFLGGLFAVRFKNKLHLAMAFTAGILLGVVAFDILPEIIDQLKATGVSSIEPMIALVVGFLLFHVLEKLIVIHHGQEESYSDHRHPHVGILSAVALIGHSFMDGVGIGLGFQISPAVGLLVAIAVISHDFADGINTITLMLSHNNSDQKAKSFLILDSIAPILGALSTLLFSVPDRFLLWYLGFFAGFLLYIGISDILPEAHAKRSSFTLIGLTILGTVFIFIVTRFA